jgi:glutamine synthetase
MDFRVGTEPEMMWLKRGADGKPDGGFSNPYCYHIDQFESLRPVFMKVIDYCYAMGLDMIQGDHEDAPGQLELNWMFDDVTRNSDRLATYRQICAQVARENNLIACFMTKPFMGVSASGCHTNISLWTGGEESVNRLHNDSLPGMEDVFTYRSGGENTFMPDTDDVQLPGKVGLQCVGGIVKHLGALTAIGCSTVNSYRRLWDTGFWAPVFADWGYQNRTTGLRVSAPGRFEYRAVDSMVNPYLMGAALLKTFEDGIDNDIDPGEPENRNIYQAMEEGKQVRKLPMSLGEALDRLANDEVIKSAMPDEMYKVFHWYKNDEWERFMATTTEWDMETYLDCLP